nr:hypothetical protein [Tanacetum cinerariifolium]
GGGKSIGNGGDGICGSGDDNRESGDGGGVGNFKREVKIPDSSYTTNS